MPYRRLPNSLPSVLRALTKARDNYKNTLLPADRAISTAQFALVDDTVADSLLNRLIKEATDVDLAEAAQTPLTTAVSQTAARLTMFASHFHQVLDLGITRGTFASGARSYYGRDVGAGSIPDLSDYDAVADAAGKIVTGEAARATAEGAAYVPMALPTAADVAALRTTFLTQRNQQQQAIVKTDREREEVQPVYAEAQAAAVDFADTVEYFYRKDKDDSSRRQKCERWGVVYVFATNETGAPPTGGGTGGATGGTPPT